MFIPKQCSFQMVKLGGIMFTCFAPTRAVQAKAQQPPAKAKKHRTKSKLEGWWNQSDHGTPKWMLEFGFTLGFWMVEFGSGLLWLL